MVFFFRKTQVGFVIDDACGDVERMSVLHYNHNEISFSWCWLLLFVYCAQGNTLEAAKKDCIFLSRFQIISYLHDVHAFSVR